MRRHRSGDDCPCQGVTHTCHFLPPAPLLTLLSRASAPPPAAQVWRTPPACPPVQVETTLHLVQTSMPLLLIPPWVQVHQSNPQLPITSLRNIKPYKCPPCYIYQCTCSNRCLCICPFINRECISLPLGPLHMTAPPRAYPRI